MRMIQFPRTSSSRAITLAMLAVIFAGLTARPVQAAALTWDTVIAANGTIDAGSGTWLNGAGNWNNGTTSVGINWNNVTPDTATFGGADGTYAITVGGAISAGGTTAVSFNNSGYTLSAASAQTITLAGNLSVANGKSATIGNNVTVSRGAGYSVLGGGTLNISGTGAAVRTTTGNLSMSGASTKVVVGTGGFFASAGSMVIGSSTDSGVALEVNGGDVRNDTTSGANLIIANGASGSASITLTSGSISNVLIGGSLRFGGSGSAAGTFHLNGGTLTLPRIIEQNTSVSSTFNFNGGTLRALATSSFLSTFMQGIDTANVRNGGAIIDPNGATVTIAQNLVHSLIGGDAATDGGLVVNDTAVTKGLLNLTGTNTYTGPTVVRSGNLALNLPASSSGLTLASGTASTITVGNNSWTNAAINVTNATLTLALGAVTNIPSASTAVIKTAALNVSGVNVINLSGSGLTLGTYKLIDYTSSGNRAGGGSFVLGTLPSGIVATLVDGPNDVSLNVTFLGQSLIWSASVNNEWSTNGVLNWDAGTKAYLEYTNGLGDVVNFTDAPSSAYTVNVTGDVRPVSVVLSHSSAATVTFTNVGAIAGTNGITKTGSGTTIMALNNAFSGVALVTNGILQVDNTGALGSTAGGTTVSGTGTVLLGNRSGAGMTVTDETITLNGAGFGGVLGQLRGSTNAGGNVWAGPIVLAANSSRIGTENSGTLTVSGPITDNGSNFTLLYRVGTSGTITAAGSGHSYGATATFCGTGGIVKLGANNGFSTNALLVGVGTVDLNGFNPSVAGLDFFSGNGVIVNNGAGASTLSLAVTGTNAFTASCAINDGSQPISLTKSGSGTQTLTNANTYTGQTILSAGTLKLNGAGSINNSSQIAVTGGATFDVSGLSSPPLALGASQTLANSGAGTANLVGNISAGSATVALNYGPGTPSFETSGTLTLAAGTTFTVNNTGAQLGHGDHKLIGKSGAGTVTGLPSAYSITGGGAATPNSLRLVSGELYLTVNNAPVAGSFALGVASYGSAVVQIAKHATDLDTDTLTITGVSSTNATISGGSIVYTNATGSNESFTYTVSDGLGGTATGTVTVQTYSAKGFNKLSGPTGTGPYSFSYLGIPNEDYALEESPNLTPPYTWTPVVTNTTAANGALDFNGVTLSYPAGSFRTRHVP